jgi:hypothetical protein
VIIPPLKVFTPAQSDDLEKALPADSSYELYEERMADPGAALVQRNFQTTPKFPGSSSVLVREGGARNLAVS